ncbi:MULTISPECIES: hypothetical protein [Streptomyces]|uniref:Uncharacterized protein n=1 Tax=Streptomyces doebereineriae TaxID=3075528 RepID=A0ABU2VGC9_9ACTN|nr:hypothetical protein [Streptomyces sp. DSM 41640]MDT0484628.1 hypothetical protein [Streptomyces sp. DSM 41640]
MPCLKTHIQREYTSYLYGALPLCVVLAHEDSRPWYLEHYVQLHSEYSPSSGEQPHLDFADSFGYQRVLECQTLDWTAVAEAGPSVIDLIRDRISAGHHGTVFVDDDHLRGREFVRLHEYLVFGYDDERREIAVVGFGGRPRIFRELRFSYDDFTTAFRQAKAAVDEGRSDVRYPVQLLRPRPLAHSFSPARLAQALQNYLSGTPGEDHDTGTWWSTPTGQAPDPTDLEIYAGTRTYDHLAHHLAQVKNGTAALDYRRFHLLSEHKGMILRRITHLADSCALHQPLTGTLRAYRDLDHQVREFRLRLLFLPPAESAHEATLGMDFLERVRETETRLLEQTLRITGFM